MDDMDEIYRRHAQAVYKYLLSLCRDEGLAEELMQETFYQAVKSIERFDGKCKIPVWLCQIGKHLYYKELRKSGRELPMPEEFPIPAPSAEESILKSEDKTRLLKAVHKLPEPYREVVYLRSFGELSFRELGEVMGKSENWARVTFYRGKEKLRGGLKMKNDLSCDVVRDLLPSYIEELTSDDSNQAIQEHMSRCGECRQIYRTMCEDSKKEKAESKKELDYLKTVKKKSRKKLWTAVGITAGALLLIFVIGIFSHNFLIGSPVYAWNHRPDISVTENNFLHLEFSNPDSAHSYAHWSTEYIAYGSPGGEGKGEINISVREVLSSPIYPSGRATREISLDNIAKVSFMGRTLWENGLIISQRAEQLSGRATKYVGSAYEVRAIFEAFKMPESSFNIAIQSDSEPYGLQLRFSEPLSAEDYALMEKNAVLTLALVDNLGEFSWSFNDGVKEITDSVSLEEAFSRLPEMFEEYNLKTGSHWKLLPSLKDYAGSSYSIQQLLNVLNY